MQFKLNCRILRPSEDQLLADLRACAHQQSAKTITSRQYHAIGNYYTTVYVRKFGSWNKALIKAGLQPAKEFRVGPLPLLHNIRHLWITLGRQPHAADLVPPHSRYGRKPYLRVFGTWLKALQYFVDWSAKNTPNTITTTTGTPAPARTITWRIRYLVMKRDNFRCTACGASPATQPGTTLHIDHIQPVSKGGTSDPHNLQTLCRTCNIGKSNLS